jgi:hypothetical protein
MDKAGTVIDGDVDASNVAAPSSPPSSPPSSLSRDDTYQYIASTWQ